MNTVLFVNATIVFSENLFLVNYKFCTLSNNYLDYHIRVLSRIYCKTHFDKEISIWAIKKTTRLTVMCVVIPSLGN